MPYTISQNDEVLVGVEKLTWPEELTGEDIS